MKRLAALLASTALAFAPGLSFAAPPSSDGVSALAGTSASATITTSGSSGVLVVPICTETINGTQPSVTSVNATGLTFTRRSTSSISTGGGFATLEVWTAPYSSTLSSLAVSVSLSGSVDDGVFGVQAVKGLNSNAAPFDTNGAVPSTTTNNTSSAQPTPPVYSTSQANDLIIAASCAQQGAADTASGYTTSFNGHGPGPNILFAWVSLIYAGVTSTQSGASITYNNPGNTVNVRYVDAMTADASGGGGSLGARRSLLGVGK